MCSSNPPGVSVSCSAGGSVPSIARYNGMIGSATWDFRSSCAMSSALSDPDSETVG